MHYQNGRFIRKDGDMESPLLIQSPEELTDVVNTLGFLPLFQNQIPGFSVVEMADQSRLWTGDPKADPWEWREQIARQRIITYSKMFGKKAGFVSKEWYPTFANYRRDGYDFDSRYEDGLASHLDKEIYDQIASNPSISSFDLKALICGRSRKGTGFDSALTRLQMQTYITVTDFCRKKTKQGDEYGWPAAVYSTPEELFGIDFVCGEYKISPMESKNKILHHLKEIIQGIDERSLEKFIR